MSYRNKMKLGVRYYKVSSLNKLVGLINDFEEKGYPFEGIEFSNNSSTMKFDSVSKILDNSTLIDSSSSISLKFGAVEDGSSLFSNEIKIRTSYINNGTWIAEYDVVDVKLKNKVYDDIKKIAKSNDINGTGFKFFLNINIFLLWLLYFTSMVLSSLLIVPFKAISVFVVSIIYFSLFGIKMLKPSYTADNSIRKWIRNNLSSIIIGLFFFIAGVIVTLLVQ